MTYTSSRRYSTRYIRNLVQNPTSKTFLQASNSNDDGGNNKKDTTPTLDIIEFCIFDNETLYYFENEFANIKNTTTTSDG